MNRLFFPFTKPASSSFISIDSLLKSIEIETRLSGMIFFRFFIDQA